MSRKRALALAAVTAGVTSLAASGVADAATPPASSVPSTTMSQAQAIAAGQMTYSRVQNADGSKTDSYTLGSGITATAIEPPAGFSPLTASDATLVKYGFPIRPTEATSLQSWTTAMAAWKSTPMPQLTVTPEPRHTTPYEEGEHVSNGNLNTTTWAGYVSSAPAGTFTGSLADFIAPNVGAGCYGPAAMSIWTGMGGLNSALLIQSGIEVGEGLGGPTAWQPWWELYDGNAGVWPPIRMTDNGASLSINPEDSIYSKTTYNPSAGSASFYLEDVTTGVAASFTATNNSLTGPISTYYDGSTADFITEFPDGLFAPFQQFAMVNAEGYANGTWYPVGAVDPFQITALPHVTSGPLGSDNKSFAVGFLSC